MELGYKNLEKGLAISVIKKLNTFKNLFDKKVSNFINIEDWFSLIRSSNYINKINYGRTFEKGSEDYNKIKKSLPTITFNFNFTSKILNANIACATGLLFIDIDSNEFSPSILDKSKIFSFYKSYGGAGYTILVRVEGLTLNNFLSTYNAILIDLNLEQFYDKGGRKATQLSVLSYDEDIFINNDSFIFESVPPTIVNKREEKAYTIVRGTNNSTGNSDDPQPLRFNNLNEIEFDGMYTVNWEGYEYINCWIPMKKLNSGRNNFLLGYANNLVYLNPSLTYERAFNVLRNVGATAFEGGINDAQITRVLTSIFKYKEAGKLKPILNQKKRKIVFSQSPGMTRDEKLEICRAELNKKRTATSLQKIYEVIENWNFNKEGKITIRAISGNYSVSKKTVTKYWSEFKYFVKELNDKFMKENKKITPIKKRNFAVEDTSNAISAIPVPVVSECFENSLNAIFNISGETVVISLYDKLKELYDTLNEGEAALFFDRIREAKDGAIYVDLRGREIEIMKSTSETKIFAMIQAVA